MTLKDAIFNWLQIKQVSEARPDDHAAQETCAFFAEILRDDHGLTNIEVALSDNDMYDVRYETEGTKNKQMFSKELVDRLLDDINSNPKYNE